MRKFKCDHCQQEFETVVEIVTMNSDNVCEPVKYMGICDNWEKKE